MTAWRWARTDRETLRALLPEAVVLLPIGATEQHGPHLATGTDAILAELTCERAADRVAAESPRPLIVAPALPFGASDHHLPFGGTLSLTPETLLGVLLDVARSVAVQGGSRLVVVNGHGGNTGVAHAFAAAAAHRHGMSVARLDYWQLADGDCDIPGHAGEFETSLMLAAQPECVKAAEPRTEVFRVPTVDDVDVHSAQVWLEIDGYTGDPHRAEARQGSLWLDAIVAAMAHRFVELARSW